MIESERQRSRDYFQKFDKKKLRSYSPIDELYADVSSSSKSDSQFKNVHQIKQRSKKKSCKMKLFKKEQEQKLHEQRIKRSRMNQLIQESQQSMSSVIMNHYQDGNRRQVVYQCNDCGKKFKKNLKRAQDHKSNHCPKRKQRKQLKQIVLQKEQKIKFIVQKFNQQNEIFEHFQDNNNQPMIKSLVKKMQNLETQMRYLKQNPGKSFVERQNYAAKISQNIFESTIRSAGPVIKHKIKQQIIIAFQNQDLQPSAIERIIELNLFNRLLLLDVRQLLLSWSHEFKECCKQILDGNKQKRAETKSRDLTASKILQSFNQYQLTTNHRKLIQYINSVTTTKYQRSNIVRFYGKLFNKFPNLKLKKLPSNIDVYKFVMKRKIISIQNVKDKVLQLWVKKDKSLSCDVWFTVCMGLRRSQLEKIYFSQVSEQQQSQNKYFQYIKVYEKKNGNQTVRFIPESLICLIEHSKNTYPITPQRFQKVRQYCSSDEIGQFYGLRHVCLTNLVRALLSNNQMKFHKNMRTTIDRYVDLDTKQFVDKVFAIDQLEKAFKKIKITYSNVYPHFKRQKAVQYSNIKAKVHVIIEEDQQNDLLADQIQDAVISNSINNQYVIGNNHNKANIFRDKFVFQNYRQQLLEEGFNYVSLINQFLLKADIFPQDIRQILKQNQNLINIKSQLQAISTILNCQVTFLEFKQTQNSVISTHPIKIQSNFITNTQSLIQQSTNQIIIAKNNQSIKISQSIQKFKKKQNLLSQNSSNLYKRKQNLRNYNKKKSSVINPQYHMQSGFPFCNNCLKFLQPFIKNKKFHLKCQYCKKIYYCKETNHQKIVSGDKVKLTPLFEKKSPLKFDSIQIQTPKRENNLQKKVQQRFGIGSFSNMCFYSEQFPSQITVDMHFHSEYTQKSLIYNAQNEKYLPLEIKESQIPKAGLGLWATANIKKNSIILLYRGVYRTNHSIDPHNDSIFILGNLSSGFESDPFQVCIQPTIRLNSARFINSGSVAFPSNSATLLGLCKNQKRQTQLVLFIYSLEQIKSGSEIRYGYGEIYEFNHFEKEPMEEEQEL